ncbi:MAG: hypothetical protein M3P53_06490 [Actinomycetota bacterium]|nr:hypothetical protein [Actinomycetota bacterium]
MPKPQQPELRRSDLGATNDDSAKSDAASTVPAVDDHGTAPVPPANQPGNHPDEEQDKPDLDAFLERASGRAAGTEATGSDEE